MTLMGSCISRRRGERTGRPAIQDPEIRQRLVALEARLRAHEYSGYRQLSRAARRQGRGPRRRS